VELREWPPHSPRGGGTPRGQAPLTPRFYHF